MAFIDRQAHRHQDGKLTFVVLDNAPIHCHIDPEQAGTWIGDHQLIVLHLPPYSPELNPIEILWKQAKYHCTFVTWTKQSLVREITSIFDGYGDKFLISFA